MQRNMSKFLNPVERDQLPPSKIVYAHSEVTSDARICDLEQLQAWERGEEFPSFVEDFNGWWLATSIKYKLVTTTLYLIDWHHLHNVWWNMMLKIPEPSWVYDAMVTDRIYNQSTSGMLACRDPSLILSLMG